MHLEVPPENQVCCGVEVQTVCSVTEGSSLIWDIDVQPNIRVSFLGTNFVNSPIHRGEFKFLLTDVIPDGQYYNFSSTSTVSANAEVNGTDIVCPDGVDSERTTLILSSSK